MKKPFPAWLALLLIALISGLLLSGTNLLTRDRVEEQDRLAANAARERVLSAADSFDSAELPEGSALDGAYIGVAGGEPVGYVGQITVNGYGGEIEVVVGVGLDGAITGVSVGGANFAETVGLGAKTKDEAFTSQFEGLTEEAELGGNVDAVSGATVSSNAVTTGVNKVARALRGQFLNAESAPDAVSSATESSNAK